MEELCAQGRISAIGECGFDLFNEEFRQHESEQESLWRSQTALAKQYSLPLIIHTRKALHHIFADAQLLQQLPAIVFHGWPGSSLEAESLLSRGINAYFSCGKGLLRGARNLSETAARLPIGRLLTETDAPYMTSRDEPYSALGDIHTVFNALCEVREESPEVLASSIRENFKAVFSAAR